MNDVAIGHMILPIIL